MAVFWNEKILLYHFYCVSKKRPLFKWEAINKHNILIIYIDWFIYIAIYSYKYYMNKKIKQKKLYSSSLLSLASFKTSMYQWEILRTTFWYELKSWSWIYFLFANLSFSSSRTFFAFLGSNIYEWTIKIFTFQSIQIIIIGNCPFTFLCCWPSEISIHYVKWNVILFLILLYLSIIHKSYHNSISR